MSATQLIEPTSRASAARGKTRRRPLPLLPPSFCLPPVESWRGTSPIQAAKSRPDRNTVRRRRHDRGRPQNPDARDGLNPPAHLVGAVLGYDLCLGSSGLISVYFNGGCKSDGPTYAVGGDPRAREANTRIAHLKQQRVRYRRGSFLGN
jgi:hypothetical protein